VTQNALDFALESLGINDAALRERLMQLYLRLEPFPEVPSVLAKLKLAGLQTAILSNGTPAMLDAIVQSAGLAASLDAVLSVEQAGVFKPHPDVYRLATNHFAVAPSAITFVSSNGWDAYAASAFGMKVVWCNRYGQRPERLPGNPDHVIRTLAELPALIFS